MDLCNCYLNNLESKIYGQVIKNLYLKNKYFKYSMRLKKFEKTLTNNKTKNNYDSSNTYSANQSEFNVDSKKMIGDLECDDNLMKYFLNVKKLHPDAFYKKINSLIELRAIDFKLDKDLINLYVYEIMTGISFEENKLINFSVSLDENSRLLGLEVLSQNCFPDNKEIIVRIKSFIKLTSQSIKRIIIYLNFNKEINLLINDK